MTKHNGSAQLDYDLVVIGAGIAGLNALHAASANLEAGTRVLLVDEKDAPGGMWNMAYDYVRLHQPHPMFTAGDIPWQWDKPRDYLAARDEVQQHLAHCLDVLRRMLTLDERFGHAAYNVTEMQNGQDWHARLEVCPKGAPEAGATVTARRVINAAGFNVSAPDAIRLSASNVRSITPAVLRVTLEQTADAPVYVVGGGKTGMDTILAVRAQNPNRPITLINGRGTVFFNRNSSFPKGLRRWFSGQIPGLVARDCAIRFDGQNAEDVHQHLVATYAGSSDPRGKNFVWGILSKDEATQIEAALTEKLWDYLKDVVDGPDGPQMQLRSGETQAVPAGSIFVNCSGSLVRPSLDTQTVQCLSPRDAILSITPRHAMHLLTTYSSFVLSHLFLSGKLREAGLYFLNLEELLARDPTSFGAVTLSQSYHNLLMAFRNLPTSARAQFGVDINTWFPKTRLLWQLKGIRKTARQDIMHCRTALDKVVERNGIQGGTLPQTEAV